MFKFDEKQLVADLNRVAPELRVLFAAACAERQMPAYRSFVGRSANASSETIRRALDDIWENPGKKDGIELQRQLQECMALIPQEAVIKPWTEAATYAQNAGMSVAYTLRTRSTGKAQEAAWSARVAYESLDHFVNNRENVDTNSSSGEAHVLSHPLVQAELGRQRRDLDELFSVSGESFQNVVSSFRNRAKRESATFFGIQ